MCFETKIRTELQVVLQPDPTIPDPFDPQSLNRYSYTRNDPVNFTDPTGLARFEVVTGEYAGRILDFDPPAGGTNSVFGGATGPVSRAAPNRLVRPTAAGRKYLPALVGGRDVLDSSGRQQFNVGGEAVLVVAPGGGESQAGTQRLQDGRIIAPGHPLARSMIAAQNRSGGSDAFHETMMQSVLGAAAISSAAVAAAVGNEAGALALGRAALEAAKRRGAGDFLRGFAQGAPEGFLMGVAGPGQRDPTQRLPDPIGTSARIAGQKTGRVLGRGIGIGIRKADDIAATWRGF